MHAPRIDCYVHQSSFVLESSSTQGRILGIRPWIGKGWRCTSGGTSLASFCEHAHRRKTRKAREWLTAKLQASHCRLNQLKLEESRSARTLERAGGGFGGVPSSRSRKVAFEPVRAGWEAFDRSIAMASESVGKSADISSKSATFHFFPYNFAVVCVCVHSPETAPRNEKLRSISLP